MSSSYKYPTATWGVYAIFNPLYKNRLDSALKDVMNTAIKDGFRQDELKKSVTSWLEQRQTYLGNDQNLAWRLTDFMSDGKDLSYYSDYENKEKALHLTR